MIYVYILLAGVSVVVFVVGLLHNLFLMNKGFKEVSAFALRHQTTERYWPDVLSMLSGKAFYSSVITGIIVLGHFAILWPRIHLLGGGGSAAGERKGGIHNAIGGRTSEVQVPYLAP